VCSPIVGRDKLYRAIQYLARFLAFCTLAGLLSVFVLIADPLALSAGQLDTLRKGYSNETVARLSALKSTLALSRKRTCFPRNATSQHN
jgi:peroxin-11B